MENGYARVASPHRAQVPGGIHVRSIVRPPPLQEETALQVPSRSKRGTLRLLCALTTCNKARFIVVGLVSTILVNGCQGPSAGVKTEGPLRVVGGEPGPFGYAFWSMTPGDSTVVSAGAVRLCLLDEAMPVTITRVYYQDAKGLAVNGWATAPLPDRDPVVTTVEPVKLTDIPGFRDGSRVVAAHCDRTGPHPADGQTQIGWEATLIGSEVGVGRRLVIEYAGSQGQGGTLTIDTTLLLCATEQQCADADADL